MNKSVISKLNTVTHGSYGITLKRLFKFLLISTVVHGFSIIIIFLLNVSIEIKLIVFLYICMYITYNAFYFRSMYTLLKSRVGKICDPRISDKRPTIRRFIIELHRINEELSRRIAEKIIIGGLLAIVLYIFKNLNLLNI